MVGHARYILCNSLNLIDCFCFIFYRFDYWILSLYSITGCNESVAWWQLVFKEQTYEVACCWLSFCNETMCGRWFQGSIILGFSSAQRIMKWWISVAARVSWDRTPHIFSSFGSRFHPSYWVAWYDNLYRYSFFLDFYLLIFCLRREYVPALLSSKLVWYVVTSPSAIVEGKYTIVASTSTQKIIFFRGLTIVVVKGKSKVGQKKKICVLLNWDRDGKEEEVLKPKTTTWFMEEFIRSGEEKRVRNWKLLIFEIYFNFKVCFIYRQFVESKPTRTSSAFHF